VSLVHVMAFLYVPPPTKRCPSPVDAAATAAAQCAAAAQAAAFATEPDELRQTLWIGHAPPGDHGFDGHSDRGSERVSGEGVRGEGVSSASAAGQRRSSLAVGSRRGAGARGAVALAEAAAADAKRQVAEGARGLGVGCFLFPRAM
jgi:hypothetical protein